MLLSVSLPDVQCRHRGSHSILSISIQWGSMSTHPYVVGPRSPPTPCLILRNAQATQPRLDQERSHKPSAIRRGINLERTLSKILTMNRGNLSYQVTEGKFFWMNMSTFKEIRQTPDYLFVRFVSNTRPMKTI